MGRRLKQFSLSQSYGLDLTLKTIRKVILPQKGEKYVLHLLVGTPVLMKLVQSWMIS